MEEEEAHTETLICFRYSPYFPPRLPRTIDADFFRYSLSFSVITFLLPLFLSRNMHPLA